MENTKDRLRRLSALLFCALCMLPPIMAFTYPSGAANYTVADSTAVTNNEETWWLLNTTGSVYSDRWYFWIELLGAALILIGTLAVLKANRERLAAGQSLGAWAKRYFLAACLALVLVWAAVSTLLSGDWYRCIWGTGYRHDGLFSYMIYGGAFLTAIWLAKSGKKYVRAVLECLTAAGVFSSVVIMLKIDGPWLEISGDTRAGFFCQYNHQGYFNTVCWAACAVLLLTDAERRAGKPKNARTVLLFAWRAAEMWLLCNAVMICDIRGSFLAVCGVLALLNLLLLPRKELRRALLFLDALFVLTCLCLNTGSNIFARFLMLLEELMKPKENWKRMGSSRGILWYYGLTFAAQKPIFGYGPDNLGELYEAAGLGTDRPHNEYIQIAAMLGFPALAAYLAGLAVHFKRFWNKRRQCSVLCAGCMCIAAGYLAGAFVGNSMYYTTPYFYMCLGFSLGLYLTETDAQTQENFALKKETGILC